MIVATKIYPVPITATNRASNTRRTINLLNRIYQYLLKYFRMVGVNILAPPCNPLDTLQLLPICFRLLLSSRENIIPCYLAHIAYSRNEWQIEIWVTIHPPYFSLILLLKRENIPFHLDPVRGAHSHPSSFIHPYFLSSVIVQERKLYTLSRKSRNEWQIEIWVANHFKILYTYYTWSLSWTTYYLTMQNKPFGEKNNSIYSIALDDPSSILMKRLCIFARTIIPTSFLILILYNAHLDPSNVMTMLTREKNLILIWLLINYLIKLTNYSCAWWGPLLNYSFITIVCISSFQTPTSSCVSML